MIHARLLSAFYGAAPNEQWPTFARAVVAEVRAAGGMSAEAAQFVEAAAALWSRRPGAAEVLAHKQAVWAFLEAKNGDTTTVRDGDDRALRAVLAALEHDRDLDFAHDSAEWVDAVLTGGYRC